MKLYHFQDPSDYKYAQAARRGTWYPDPSPGLCPECGSSRQRIVPPLVIEWYGESDLIGDFTWASYSEYIVVQQRVRDLLEAQSWGVEFRPIVMVQDPRLKQTRRPTKRTKPRVWLPYEGPPLWRMQATTTATLDYGRSGYKIKKKCGTCGTVFYEVPPREVRCLVVDPTTWSGAAIFWMGGSAGAVFCTERVKMLVEECGFTNVGFLEDGIIPG